MLKLDLFDIVTYIYLFAIVYHKVSTYTLLSYVYLTYILRISYVIDGFLTVTCCRSMRRYLPV